MLFNIWFATSISEVGISAFDFFSIGHICFGIGTLLFFSLFYTIPKQHGNKPLLPLWLVFTLTLIVLIAWEFIENILFFDLGWKFEGRKDSILNITTDIIIGALGAGVNTYLAYKMVELDRNMKGYYIFGLISLAIWIILFVIFRQIAYLVY